MLLGELTEKLQPKTDWNSYVQKVSDAYMEAPDHEPGADIHWKVLIVAVEKQFDQIAEAHNKGGAQRYKVKYVHGQPYKSAKEVIDDLTNNHRILVSQEANTHPIWTPEQNLKFRAVHDIYGHFHGLNSFEVFGEIKAYNKHIKTLPRNAVPAMFTEVVGQACAFKATGDFQKQKICLLDQFDYYNLGVINDEAAA